MLEADTIAAGVPLLAQNQIIGALVVGSPVTLRWRQGDC